MGIGIGGVLPILVTLISEYSSPKIRGRNICLLVTFWAFGLIISILLAWFMSPYFSWRIYLIFAGILSLLFSSSIFIIPESQRYLLKIGHKHEAFSLAKKYSAPYIEEISKIRLNVMQEIKLLFKGGMWKITISFWIIWLVTATAYYGIFIWLPVIVASGISVIEIFYEQIFIYLLIIGLA